MQPLGSTSFGHPHKDGSEASGWVKRCTRLGLLFSSTDLVAPCFGGLQAVCWLGTHKSTAPLVGMFRHTQGRAMHPPPQHWLLEVVQSCLDRYWVLIRCSACPSSAQGGDRGTPKEILGSKQ